MGFIAKLKFVYWKSLLTNQTGYVGEDYSNMMVFELLGIYQQARITWYLGKALKNEIFLDFFSQSPSQLSSHGLIMIAQSNFAKTSCGRHPHFTMKVTPFIS